MVSSLALQLKSKSLRIRETALLELGNIGQPEASSALEVASRCLSDSESSIRSAACWTVARIGGVASRRIESRLGVMLRDSYWKVRTSASIALGLTVKGALNTTVEALIKVLQDGSVPKAVVCETLARMGAEELLL